MTGLRLLAGLVLICGFCAAGAEPRPISALELTQVAEPGQFSISPNGKLVAFVVGTPLVEPDETRIEIVIADIESGRVIQKVQNGTLIRSWYDWFEADQPSWSPDSRYVFERALQSGEIQVWRIDSTSGNRIKITSDPADVEGFSLSPDGTTLLYQVRNSRQEVLRRNELSIREGFLADESLLLYDNIPGDFWVEGHLATLIVHSDSLFNTVLLDDAAGVLRQKALSLQSGTPRELGAPAAPTKPAWDALGIKDFDDDGKGEIAVVRELPNVPGRYDFSALQILRAADGRILSECTAPDCIGVLQGSRWWREGRIVFIRNSVDGAQRIIEEWNPATGSVRRIATVSGILVGREPYRLTGKEADCPIAGTDMICEYEDSNVAPRVIRINLTDGRIDTLFDPNGTLTVDRLGRVETRGWQDELGNHLFTKMVFPPNYDAHRRYPLVISSYMCKGFLRGGSGAEFPEYLFAQAGMLSICINYNGINRRYPTSATEFQQIPPLRRGSHVYESIIRDLDRRGLIDVDHIGIGGLSWSSKLVAWELFHSKRFAAASIGAPSLEDPIYADWLAVDFWDQTRKLNGLPASDDPNDPAWRIVSAAVNARKIETPLMINAVVSEARVGIQLYAALRRRKVPLEMYVYPHDDHQIFAYPSHRASIYERNVDWFRFWLQGFEDPAATKSEQYARWRRMRADWKNAS